MQKTEIQRGKKIEYLLAIPFIMPYFEIKIIRDLFDWRISRFYIPSSIFFMLAASLLLLFIIIKRRLMSKFTNRIIPILRIKVILDIIILIRGFFVYSFINFFTQYLWFTIPFYYATIIVIFIDVFDLSITSIIKKGLLYFIIYLLINIVMNFQKYGFNISDNKLGERLISPGGGPVIFGYTIVLVMCVVLMIQNELTPISTFFTVLILAIGSIFTGTRGSIWPLMLLIFIYLITGANKLKIMSILLLVLFIFVNPVLLIGDFVPRIMNLVDFSRTFTLLNSITVFFKQPTNEMFFGTGLGHCFPYQVWLFNVQNNIYTIPMNIFNYKGYSLLVQPHNSFLYLLLETGLTGTFLFVFIFIKALFIIKANSYKNSWIRYFTIIIIIILNLFDSVFIIQPGSAGLWWFLFFITIYKTNKDKARIIER